MLNKAFVIFALLIFSLGQGFTSTLLVSYKLLEIKLFQIVFFFKML
jgi:hypothetical protein